MIQSIEKAIEEFMRELALYDTWDKITGETHNSENRPDFKARLTSLPVRQRNEFETMKNRLEGMQAVLGITEEELDEILKKHNYRHPCRIPETTAV